MGEKAEREEKLYTITNFPTANRNLKYVSSNRKQTLCKKALPSQNDRDPGA